MLARIMVGVMSWDAAVWQSVGFQNNHMERVNEAVYLISLKTEV